jgi:hypothetical protein
MSVWQWILGRVGAGQAPVAGMQPDQLLNAGVELGRISGPEEIATGERAYIDAYRAKTARAEGEPLVGLALSGGGIRSASIALGVLQGLAARGILKRFDYLSTVSGGGYIGSALTWFTSRPWPDDQGNLLRFGTGDVGAPFPYGTQAPGEAPAIPPDVPGRLLRFLAQHANYLEPVEGISVLKPLQGVNIVGAVAVVLRGILLNLFVWLSIATGLMLGLILLGPLDKCTESPVFTAALIVSGALLAVFAVVCVGYSLATAKERLVPGDFAVELVEDLASFGYYSRRAFDIAAPLLLVLAGVALLIGFLPQIDSLLSDKVHAVGFWSILTGIASGLWAFWQSRQSTPGKPSTLSGIAGPAGAFLILYGTLLGAFHVAHAVACEPDRHPNIVGIFSWFTARAGELPFEAIHRFVPYGANLDSVVWIYIFVLAAFVIGWFVDLNYVSIHRYYRDRLMEAFMPDPERALRNETGAAIAGDPARLSAMCPPGDAAGPYHIVNCNVMLNNSSLRRWNQRAGDSFILSPLYCGSSATGWIRTDHWIDDTMTLATAMAISGAAANPGAGTGGVGPTRNRLVALLMSMLSLRLGYWVSNPRLGAVGPAKPNHFRPGLDEVVDLGLREDSRILQLSDGGHFDNLGVYELFRRKVRLIVVSDGTADSGFAFGDLQTVLPRIREDFGATVVFDDKGLPDGAGIDGILPLVPAQNAGRYPAGAALATRGYALARITYADGTTGTLVYLKAAALEAMTLEMLGYKGRVPDFPNESTLDQFYSEEKFEAHRALGYLLVTQMLSECRKHIPAHPKLAWL